MEKGFDIVVTLVKDGSAAAWQKIVESLTNLREMVIEQVITFVRDRVIQSAIVKLLSLLSPVGAFIQAIIGIYNTVMFFVERMSQIAQVAASFIDSISAIANGVIASAAKRVEDTMARLLTLVISFLARIAGLGNVSQAVMNVINRVRQPIDKALDRVIAWIVEQAKRFGRFLATTARSAAAGVANWWRLRTQFSDEAGQRHSLSFRGQDRAAEVIVESVPRPISVFLKEAKSKADQSGNPRYKELVSSASRIAEQIRVVVLQIGSASCDSQRVTQLNKGLDAKMKLLAEALTPLLPLVGTENYAGLREPDRLNKIVLREKFKYTPPPQGREYRSSLGESKRQVKLQKEAIGNMKVNRWRANVEAFAARAKGGADPRDPTGTREQARVLEDERDALVLRARSARIAAHEKLGMSERAATLAAIEFVSLLTERETNTTTNRSRANARHPCGRRVLWIFPCACIRGGS